jgi:hypothetical protein
MTATVPASQHAVLYCELYRCDAAVNHRAEHDTDFAWSKVFAPLGYFQDATHASRAFNQACAAHAAQHPAGMLAGSTYCLVTARVPAIYALALQRYYILDVLTEICVRDAPAPLGSQ